MVQEQNFIRDLIGKTVKIYTLNSIFYQGVVLAYDEHFIKINDRKEGIKYVNRQTLLSITQVTQ